MTDSEILHVTAGESGGKAMARIYGNIGFAGLWNGLPVRIAMVRAYPKQFEKEVPNYFA